jgi:hypothetical protein
MNAKKVYEKYFKFIPYLNCTVLLDEHLMKRASKILFKYQEELKTLIANNKEHCIKEDWGLCYPNAKQTSFYIKRNIEANDKLVAEFYPKPVDLVVDIGDRSQYTDDVKKEIEELIIKDTNS